MGSHAPASPIPSADHSLLRAARVWLEADGAGLWDVFRPVRRAELSAAWEQIQAESAADAFEDLRQEHVAQARPDLARVHASWWVRALADESPSVQRAVASALPSGLADALKCGLNLESETTSHGAPCPAALRTALALWSERLVGDVSERDDDPPIIAAITRFDTRTVVRLIDTVGLAKWSLTAEPAPPLDRLDRERFMLFRAALGDADQRFVRVAERDVARLDRSRPRPAARLGLLSIARLLTSSESHRVRWALQHLPYSMAKSIRTSIGQAARKMPMLVRWERELLRAAWDMLHVHGRISGPWEEPA